MKKKLNQILYFWRKEHILYLGISFGIFLFVLSFQPFYVQHINYHHALVPAVVIGSIVFLTIFLVRTICLLVKESNAYKNKASSSVYDMNGFVIWLLSSVICALYLVYVERASLSFYLVYKVALVCLAPVVILMFSRKIQNLKQSNKLFGIQRSLLSHKIDDNEDSATRFIEFSSMNGYGNYSLLSSKILFIKSADNYVEIHYQDEGHMKKKLIRNTLRNLESQIKTYPHFIRCHRTCIVNIDYVEKFDSNCSTHNLTLKGYDQIIPVSRQYISKINKNLHTL